MNVIRISLIALACAAAAHADFSYTQTRKGGPAAAGDATTKHYLKGQKLKMEGPSMSTIVDLDAQTFTNINHSTKTYTVTPFSQLGQAMKDSKVDAKIDVKETGQKKNIGGYNASEVLMTMELESAQTAQKGMKSVIEFDMWLSSDPPGTQELRSFYQRNAGKFPWTSMTAGSNPSMQKAMADMQKKVAELGGVPVLQIMRMKMAGNDAQMAQMQQGMALARERLEAMKKQGGQQAQMAEQALARMGAMGGASPLVEITMESSGFSSASIPDSVFAIPAGYTKKE